MNKELIAIFEYLEREKGIKREIIISAIENSLMLAAQKSIKNVGEVSVKIDEKTGEIDVTTQKTVVDKVLDPKEEISIKEAQKLNPESQVGQVLEISITPQEFGRIAAQTARQIISQKLREAERGVIYEEYKDRVKEIISGTVKRFIKDRSIIVDLGKVEALLPGSYYPKTEKYHVGEKVLALLYEVRETDMGGAEVILSRSHPEFVSALFDQEIPELAEGIIVIEKIVREPGYRTKIAVRSLDPKIDPVGTCVGIRGTRIKNVIRELHNEKIDVIPFSEDRIEFLKNAVAPIDIFRYKETEDKIILVVNEENYPAIIGKKGMNAKLLSRLIGKEITAQKISDYQKLISVQIAEMLDSKDPILDEPIDKIKNVSSLILEELKSSGFDTIKKVLSASSKDLIQKVPGINYLNLMEKILER
ncbi:MAG: transcription elongation factor NusA [Chlamydiae bacterium SM23_39]|nr:MAG: transcription elongation factor NusA [Chlamydiae bacterium SM23_39]